MISLHINSPKNRKLIDAYYDKFNMLDKSAKEKISFIEQQFGFENCTAKTIEGMLFSAEMILLENIG